MNKKTFILLLILVLVSLHLFSQKFSTHKLYSIECFYLPRNLNTYNSLSMGDLINDSTLDVNYYITKDSLLLSKFRMALCIFNFNESDIEERIDARMVMKLTYLFNNDTSFFYLVINKSGLMNYNGKLYYPNRELLNLLELVLNNDLEVQPENISIDNLRKIW